MAFFTITRSSTAIQTFVVEASDEQGAKDNIVSAHLLDLRIEGGIDSDPQPFSMVPKENEKMFCVAVPERHVQICLITAKNPEEAVERIKEGEGWMLHASEFIETDYSPSSSWGCSVLQCWNGKTFGDPKNKGEE